MIIDKMPLNPTRRAFLSAAAGVTAALALPGHLGAWISNNESPPRYRIGGCDWIMLKRQKVGGVKLAAEIGLDGLEVDMGGLGDRPAFANMLRDPSVRQQYLDACTEHDIEICSIAASAFYAQSYADHPAADACTVDWIETMQLMNVRVGFLPMGVRSDVKNDAEVRRKVIDRLRAHAPLAEKAGVILGIEAPYSPTEYIAFFDEIGSPAVQAYYDCAGRLDAGADIYDELRALAAAGRLCQIHSTDKDGMLLKDSRIDLHKLKAALDEAGYHGWLVLERSRVSGKTMKQDFAANAALLKSVFQA